MLLTQQQLSVMCKIHCDFFIIQQNNVSAELKSVRNLRVSVTHVRLLVWNIATFISSGLWLQHSDKLPSKLQNLHRNSIAGLSQKKNHNVNRPTLCHGWHCFEQRIINNATDEWCKHPLSVHVQERLS